MCSRVRFITSAIGPEKMSSPNRMTTRWSHTASISDSWCDETITVRPLRPRSPEQLPDLHDPGRVQPVGRLVEDQQLRVREEGRGDAQPLLHAQREALHRLPVPAREADLSSTASTRSRGSRRSRASETRLARADSAGMNAGLSIRTPTRAA